MDNLSKTILFHNQVDEFELAKCQTNININLEIPTILRYFKYFKSQMKINVNGIKEVR